VLPASQSLSDVQRDELVYPLDHELYAFDLAIDRSSGIWLTPRMNNTLHLNGTVELTDLLLFTSADPSPPRLDAINPEGRGKLGSLVQQHGDAEARRRHAYKRVR
jgi:hypothetical protein